MNCIVIVNDGQRFTWLSFRLLSIIEKLPVVTVSYLLVIKVFYWTIFLGLFIGFGKFTDQFNGLKMSKHKARLNYNEIK